VDLSTGQRKRLALVHAYLEGRPVLVFDEWAADQDPTFRHLFYTELLPELRDKGHLLIVVSHDDRYFHLADRVIRMAQGRIVEGAAPASRPERAAAAA
jgi:putative ATP-binding cassette transporter